MRVILGPFWPSTAWKRDSACGVDSTDNLPTAIALDVSVLPVASGRAAEVNNIIVGKEASKVRLSENQVPRAGLSANQVP